jgi:hypothetical protein
MGEMQFCGESVGMVGKGVSGSAIASARPDIISGFFGRARSMFASRCTYFIVA